MANPNGKETMHAETKNKPNESSVNFMQLARLAHDSFEQRRSYEWKMHFGLWAAIAAVVFAAIKEKIIIFDSVCEAKYIGFSLWVIYLLHFIMVSRGHWKDKQKKHYYMDKAEGQPATLEEYNISQFWLQALWGIPYMVFTGSLIYLAIKVLLGVKINGNLG